jgi:hypothetical protein
MKHELTLILLIFLAAASLVACSTPTNLDGTEPAALIPSATRNPTRTPYPTDTTTPVPTPTTTSSPTSTLPPTPTPEMDYRLIKLYTQGFLPRFNYFFVFEFPKGIKGKYYAIVDVNKDYTCDVYPKHPERLYCWGPLVRVLDYTIVDLYAQNNAELIFSTKIFIPIFGQ